MSFLLLILALSAIVYLLRLTRGQKADLRTPMRYGIAGGFLFTGVDHFVSAQERYAPMIPGALQAYATELVYISGAAELAGAVGLLLPLVVWWRLGLPNLRPWAGIGLALLLALIVIANINVAMQGGEVAGLSFGPWYYWARPFVQPVFIVWVLYAAGTLRQQRDEGDKRRDDAAGRRASDTI